MRHILIALLIFTSFNSHAAAATGKQTADSPEQFLFIRLGNGEKLSAEQLYKVIDSFYHESGNEKLANILSSSINVAMYLSTKGMAEESANLLEKVIEKNQSMIEHDFPYKRSLYGMVGILHHTAGRYKEASERLEQSLRYASVNEADVGVKDEKIIIHLFTSYIELERCSEAHELIVEGLRNNMINVQVIFASELTLSHIAAMYDGLQQKGSALFFAKLALIQTRSQSKQGLTENDTVSLLSNFINHLQQEVNDASSLSKASDFIANGNTRHFMTDAEYVLYTRYDKIITDAGQMSASYPAKLNSGQEMQNLLLDIESTLK
ncbi:tetratricopeptide repeat protein [Desulfovibrio sp. OttesenSCG-928-G11]|nr:tetratricopeptide repeat protein [Desulfovibrio sp. OttesenSCG-928-G11]